MAATTKASKVTTARKNAEAEKAKRKAMREAKSSTITSTGKPGKKGPSLINQSKAKKKK